MATMNHHFYEQSASSWHREWADDGPDSEEMTEEEREEAERVARGEIEKALDAEAWHRKQQGEQPNVSPRLSEIELDLDAAF